MLRAITREVSESLDRCELSFHLRQQIDIGRARRQHVEYREVLKRLGLSVEVLPQEPELPDAVFVEDPVIVVDEVAVICRAGVESRRPEAATLARSLEKYRPLRFIEAPGTLEGGDVMRIARTLFVGVSHRTNQDGVEQLRKLLKPFDYAVEPVTVNKCLHLKSACSYVGDNSVLVNPDWIDKKQLHRFELVEVPLEEPGAANALIADSKVLLPSSFPLTRKKLESLGFDVTSVDVSELQKAESGVSCMSVIFNG